MTRRGKRHCKWGKGKGGNEDSRLEICLSPFFPRVQTAHARETCLQFLASDDIGKYIRSFVRSIGERERERVHFFPSFCQKRAKNDGVRSPNKRYPAAAFPLSSTSCAQYAAKRYERYIVHAVLPSVRKHDLSNQFVQRFRDESLIVASSIVNCIKDRG